MGSDLIGGLVVKLLLAAAVFAICLRYLKSARPVVLNGLAVVAVLGGTASALWLRDSAWWAQALPHGSVVVLAGLEPEWLAVLAAAAWRTLAQRRVRRSLVVAALLVLGLWCLLRPVSAARAQVRERDVWEDGVCMQTSPSSCSAASAATLLAWHGIAATEAELAGLCLTTERGTPFLCLYRGLLVKTRGSSWGVTVVRGSMSDLRLAAAPGSPLLLSVGLPRGGVEDLRYERDWGWARGQRHAVVLFRFLPDGLVEMGDPSVGRERWNEGGVATLWRGSALCLRPRSVR